MKGRVTRFLNSQVIILAVAASVLLPALTNISWASGENTCTALETDGWSCMFDKQCGNTIDWCNVGQNWCNIFQHEFGHHKNLGQFQCYRNNYDENGNWISYDGPVACFQCGEAIYHGCCSGPKAEPECGLPCD